VALWVWKNGLPSQSAIPSTSPNISTEKLGLNMSWVFGKECDTNFLEKFK